MRRHLIWLALVVATTAVGPAPTTAGTRASCDVNLSSGANIQRAIDRHREGTRFCLSGTFQISSEIRPKDGISLRGPAELVAHGDVIEAIDATKAVGVSILRLDIHGFTERAFKCGERSLVRNSYFHHNGRNGMGGGECHGMLVVRTELAFNGGDEHLGSGSAGIKVAGSRGVVIRKNHVHDNLGVGIWCDAFCSNWLVEHNVAVRNSRKGIFFEKGDGAVIRHNTATGNNASQQRVGGGIAAVSSVGVEIYGNTLGGNQEHGIKVWEDRRPYVLDDVVVYDNDLAGDDLSGCTEPGVSCWDNARIGD